MATCEDVRALALSFPDVREADHWGRPSFRVRDKIFATLWLDEERAVLKLTPEHQDLLFALHPKTYSALRWGKMVRTLVELKNTSSEELEPLIYEAWQQVVRGKRRRSRLPENRSE